MLSKCLYLLILFAAGCPWLTSEHEMCPNSPFKQRLICGASTLLYCYTGIIKIWDASYMYVDSSDCRWLDVLPLPKVPCLQSEALRIISESCNGQTQCDTLPYISCKENYNALYILYTCYIPKNVITCDGGVQRLQCGPEEGVLSIVTAHYGRPDNRTCCANTPTAQLPDTECPLHGALAMIAQRCEGRSQCEIPVSRQADPCPGICKHLQTSYTCVPAKSVVVCEHKTMSIDCGQDVIKIISSNYGRRDKTTCSAGRPDCFLQKTLTEMVNRCNGRNQCSVQASNSVFSDPCVGTVKYLEASFVCLPAERSIVCEHSVSSISCDNGAIKIYRASYGRKDSDLCSEGNPATQTSNVNCESHSSMATVSERCEGKTTCDLNASNAVFGDPCYGTYKYLDVSYGCVPFRN